MALSIAMFFIGVLFIALSIFFMVISSMEAKHAEKRLKEFDGYLIVYPKDVGDPDLLLNINDFEIIKKPYVVLKVERPDSQEIQVV